MEYPQLDLKNAKGPKAIIQTNHGDIEVQLFEKEAPMTVSYTHLTLPTILLV